MTTASEEVSPSGTTTTFAGNGSRATGDLGKAMQAARILLPASRASGNFDIAERYLQPALATLGLFRSQ